MTMNDSNPPKRRWYQFSLRTLVLLLVACAVFCGWRAYRARKNRERVASAQKAVAEIEKLRLGDSIKPAYEEQWSATWLEQLFDDPGDPYDPDSVLGIYVGYSNGAANGWEHLKELTKLKRLVVWNASVDGFAVTPTASGLNSMSVTHAGMQRLNDLIDREDLTLYYNVYASPNDLEHLKRLTNREYPSLSEINFTNAGLEYLKGLTNLEHLSLSQAFVTDAGLEHLKGLTNLRILDLKDTKVTDAGVKKLQQALPNCTIYRSR